jgi:NAD-dependent DNA ligase
MNQIAEVKPCPTCSKLMQPIPCTSRPESSEWYCSEGHHSHHMTNEEINYFVSRKIQAEG